MVQRLRVAHIGNFKPQSANGVHSAIVGLTRHLPSLDIDVQIWHCSRKVSTVGERWVEDGIKVIDLPKFAHNTRNALRLPSQTRCAVEKLADGVDLLHFHSVYTAEHIALARLGVPYIVTPHGGYSPAREGRGRFAKTAWRVIWEYPFLRGAQALQAVSVGEARELEALRLDQRIVCVPNGLDDQWLREVEAYVPPPTGGPLVFLGRLDIEVKGLDLLLEGYARARGSSLLPNLILVGPDWRGGGDWLRKRIAELGLTNNVEVRPPVFGGRKAELLKSASAFLHPSRSEGLPFVLLEALAVGRPVLVTPGTNIASEVIEYEAGIAVEATVAGVAAGICTLVEHGTTWHTEVGQHARALVQDRFTWDRLAPEIAELYREAAA